MRSQFIVPESSLWKETLELLPHDFYHTPEWLLISAKHEGGRPLAFFAEEAAHRFFAPLLVKDLPADLGAPVGVRDATAPYGYACPLVSAACEGPRLKRFVEAFVELGRQQGIVSAFFRMHPLLSLPTEPLSVVGQLAFHGETVYVDLGSSREEIWQQTRKGHQADIRKLQRCGYRAVMDEWHWYDDFVSLYRSTMQRLHANEYYFFSPEYFRALHESCFKYLHLCCALAPSGGLAAAALLLTCGPIVQYHLSASAEAYAKASPTKLILDLVRWWAKDRGYKLFHLGGGLGAAQDSLFAFKAGFSHRRAQFWTYRVILDSAQYDALAARRRQIAGTAESTTAFFPAYRNPPA
jgi:hypothetical protein